LHLSKLGVDAGSTICGTCEDNRAMGDTIDLRMHGGCIASALQTEAHSE
jgi:hypothetical protein